MKKFLLTLPVLVLLGFTIYQPKKKQKQLLIAFYNVENLFDTIDDPLTDDKEFLPASENKWNTEKFNTKINNLSKVISSLQPGSFPDVIGLCEIENKRVLEALAGSEWLKKAGYGIIHHDSPDPRGIDVAALFRKKSFVLVDYRYLHVSFEKTPDEKTRDILYIKGITSKKDTLHFYFNHWPSRRSGEKESEHKRLDAAKALKKHADSIQLKNPSAQIIIMGDLNDHPDNKSVNEIAGAKPLNEKNARFYNLLYNDHLDSLGTHYFKGKWGVLDNIIVSSALINNETGWKCSENDAVIFKPDWILYSDKNGKKAGPAKSYVGNKFFPDGYSDHLPVFLHLRK
ncbi:MAG: endonuclease/exonuclease/phosphatase family protein [Bacteroidota bacterium]